MSSAKITIDLPRLYSQINHLRQAEKLPPVSADTIAIQANLRFTIIQRHHLNFKGNNIIISRDDADVLCAVIEEVFKVRPYLYGAPGLKQNSDSNQYELPLALLYESIHEQRRVEQRIPMETAVIAVRLGVKFLILRRRVLDFKEATIFLDEADIKAIEQILAEQFAVILPHGLAILCNQPQLVIDSPEEPLDPIPNADVVPQPKSWMTRILSHFTGYGGVRQRRYRINTSALLLAITQQRAAKGYKYISPAEIQFRYGERLALELRIKSTQDPSAITLTRAQFAILTTIIQEEFGVTLDNPNDFIGKPEA